MTVAINGQSSRKSLEVVQEVQQNLGTTEKIEKAPSPEQLKKKDSQVDLSTAKKP